MATRVIYGVAADNTIGQFNATYSTARALGTPTLGTSSDTALLVTLNSLSVGVGQAFISSNYYVVQAFIGFDTTGVGTISASTLSMYLQGDSSTTDFVCEARVKDWSTTVDSGDAVAGASLSGLTLVASINSSGIGATGAYKDFADTALAANINTSGFTRLILASDRTRSNTTPTNAEVLEWRSGDDTSPPKLTITDNTTQGSQTKNGGDTTFTPTVTGLHDLDLWGAGGRPALSASQEGGAGGGAYSFAQYSVTSLSNVTIQVGNTNSTANSAGSDTWFGSSSAPDPLAKGGGASTSGGAAASGRGITKFSGGGGAAAQGGGGSRGGSGGGSSAGTAAGGANGTAGSGSSGGAKGTAPSGGGDGGNGGNSGAVGGTGTVPGGGAGGGGNGADAGNGAAGKIIVYWYAGSAKSIVPDAVAWTWSATATGLEHRKQIVPESLAWSWSATDVTLSKGRQIVPESVAWSWSATDVALEHRKQIVPESVSWAWSATDVAFNKGLTVTLDSVAWTWTAGDVEFIKAADKQIGLDSVAWTWTATDVALEHDKQLVPDTVAWSWTITDAALQHGWQIVPESVAWSYTVSDVSLEHGFQIVPESVAWSWAATDVDLVRLGALVVAPESVAWSWSATDVAFEHGYVLSADTVAWEWLAGDVAFDKTAAQVVAASRDPGAGHKRKVVPLDEWLKLHHPEASVEKQIEVIEELADDVVTAPPSEAVVIARQIAVETLRVDRLVSELKGQSARVSGLAGLLEEFAEYRSALAEAQKAANRAAKKLRELDDEEALMTLICHA